MEYTLVSAFSLRSLSEKINQHLAAGWQLTGSLFVHGGRFYRELTRPAERPQKK